MRLIYVALLGVHLCRALSASLKATEEHKTAFFGEDVHIAVASLGSSEVVFQPSANVTAEVVLLRDGRLVGQRAKLNALGHLILEDVGEDDEGTYIIRNFGNAEEEHKHIVLLVRDCSLEQVVRYGETYHIPLDSILSPVTLEFRPSQANGNRTGEPDAVVLFNQTTVPAEEYRGRLSVTEKKGVILHAVRGTDEGSFTVLDRDGKVRKRTCLNVKEHQKFEHLAYGRTLKINLYLDQAKVNVFYTPESDHKDRLILDRGQLVDPVLDSRLMVDGFMMILERVKVADRGVFKVTDLSGFPVTNIYLEVDAYKLPPLYVAILSLLGLLAFLLLVCLFSCLYNVHRRAERARKLSLIAQHAGKSEEGEAFRQVVQEAYSRFAEESTMHSQWDSNATESTEVTIKGLEVSKAGRYHTLSSDKNFLDMSDSGVEFNSSALPLDSDTEGLQTYASHKLLINSTGGTGHGNSPDITLVPDGELSATPTPDSAMSPATNPRSDAAGTPDGNLMGAASPEATRSAGEPANGMAKSPEEGCVADKVSGETVEKEMFAVSVPTTVEST